MLRSLVGSEMCIRDSDQPLSGVRVIEWATVVAAPSVGQLLAVLGAEVIKVEHPENRDLARDMMLFTMPGRNGQLHPDGTSMHASGFDAVNRSVKAVALDLGTRRGRSRFLGLVESADVLLTNTLTESCHKLGMGLEQLQQRNPRLIVAHLQAWGDKGTMVDVPGYDFGCFFAATGLSRLFQSEGKYHVYPCLLYTSDAADEEDSVDLGGRRIIQKKKTKSR
eukprot:TRINITY_DN7445_c0_g1_i2.p1 TRINITY_DN7445_c0_g1~~TRINITY_DN7445_c0_g1_i2.p1  ORF type:complete len:248 (+),score=72.66 TRINITY_DN7445_c0_g1_i2:81-746(+)